MLSKEIRRLFAWLTHSHAKVISDQPARTGDSFTVFDFDPMWHGDHWQNLLSSPMDARRYVMEDWSVSAQADWDDAEGTAPAH
ncbi:MULTISPECIES: hypothetical protein [unclassified Paraburkholderia]|uniref:hypothetical protein n=1 Tax=unclassified Paraburkholderia TaxID=2615204 RepID=UPI0016070D4F|nr:MULTISPECIES: hypothetical protein [unclassified Paraburkholderia]MBB5447290.1 hypothetical protein [Paraburkholderia sp. WSM4177]MBB5487830.1 hypothetical protein [Paraburkholderia sp. WSM4180]